ncbi:hypothetical protein BTO30_03840 [Domibacillus antri]|uniref:Uncharacterized protein n=1 Tax=Domibacillus antri TaxID=1714264 RepID=A0A1Q8Q897_9BACI|nr:hypothetical protein [Domibacillus antri]OLN23566.1 hypothetical protein BTO30_03840 [Domibacillus antri]
MCVLCNGSVLQVHWTDRKNKNESQSTIQTAGETQRSRIRERHLRIRQSNKILAVYGLKLSDWTGSKYILADKKGRSEIVQDLGALWTVAEKLLGKPIDPLDPYLIKVLRPEQAGSEGGE